MRFETDSELVLSAVMGSAEERGWAWRRNAQVFLFGCEAQCGDAHLPDLRQRDWSVVALDEAQRIKNATADVSRTIKGLTGTPFTSAMSSLRS